MVIAAYWTLHFTPEPFARESIEHFLKEEEAALGATCKSIHSNAMAFIRTEVRPMIEAGRRGEDWVAFSSEHFLGALRVHQDRTFRCQMMNIAAAGVDFPVHGNFEELYTLFSTLEALLYPYGDEPLHAKDFDPETFELVDRYYRNAFAEEGKS